MNFKSLRLKPLVVCTSTGKLDLAATVAAIDFLVADTDFEASTLVLLDSREINCALSVTDIYDLAVHIAIPANPLPVYRKVAVLIDRHSPGYLVFNHAQFCELCAANRRLEIRVLDDFETTYRWLTGESAHEIRALAPEAVFASAAITAPMILVAPMATVFLAG